MNHKTRVWKLFLFLDPKRLQYVSMLYIQVFLFIALKYHTTGAGILYNVVVFIHSWIAWNVRSKYNKLFMNFSL